MDKKPPHRFKKGQSGNPNGRPKKPKIEDMIDKELVHQMFDQASGDPYEFLKLVLKNGRELGLDMAAGFKLAKELIPYEKPKKASIETKIEEYKRIEFHMVMPEAYGELEQVYKKNPKLIEAMTEEALISVTNGETTSQDVINTVNVPVEKE